MPYPVAAVRGKGFGNPQYSDLVLSLSPLAYWPLSETGGTVAYDRTVNGYNGAYTGVDLGQAGQGGLTCPYFDGANDYCNIYSAGLAGAFSAAAGSTAVWAKVYDAGVLADGTIRNIVKFRADLQNFVDISRTTVNNQFQLMYKAGNVIKAVYPTSTSTGWIHMALTWSVAADQVIGYVNGVQSGVTQTSLGTWAGALSTTQTLIGANSTAPSLVWKGYLQYIGLWTRVLSPAEVGDLYSFFQ